MSIAKKIEASFSQLAHDIFIKAIQLPAAERLAFVESQTGETPHLARQVERLLLEHELANRSMNDSEVTGFSVNRTLDLSLVKNQTERVPHLFSPGEEVGDFSIHKIIGYGAFGVVYLAQQKSLNRPVALKVTANLGDEAQTMATLEHEGIVKVHTEIVDTARKIRILIMQYIPGTTLEKLLLKTDYESPAPLSGARLLKYIDALSSEEQPILDPKSLKDRRTLEEFDYIEASLSIGHKISNAIAYAHEKGVLHLDIKPSNILISPYAQILVSDFSVSVREDSLQPEQAVGGTKAYMSPEQRLLLGVEQRKTDEKVTIDSRSDIYSLGVVLKELLSKQAESFAPATKIVETCTQPNPEKRYANAAELSEAIENAIELRGAIKQLNTPGKILSLITKYPFAALTACIVFPQLISAYFSHRYHTLRIAPLLTIDQQFLLDSILLSYLPTAYLVGIGAWLYILSPLVRVHESVLHRPPDELRRLRSHLLNVPLWIIGITLAGWVPASLVIPFALHIFQGPLDLAVFPHFLFSFAICSLISLSYCYLYSQFIVLRVFYPKYLLGCRRIHSTSNSELKTPDEKIRKFQKLPGLVPLVSATVIAIQGPGEADLIDFLQLIVFINTIGILGVFLAGQISHHLNQVIQIFIGRSPDEGAKNGGVS